MGWETSEARWTNDRVALLRKLWSDNLSAEQIACRLGGVTRNAVIGKAHRLGLQRTPGAVSAARGWNNGGKNSSQKIRFGKGETVAKPSWTPKEIKPSATRPPIPAVHVSAITGAIIPGPDSIPPKPLPITPPIAPDAKPITLMDITSNTCCWPVTDDSPFLFCGDIRDPRSGKHDRGYCTEHWLRSISSERRGRKRADVCVGVD